MGCKPPGPGRIWPGGLSPLTWLREPPDPVDKGLSPQRAGLAEVFLGHPGLDMRVSCILEKLLGITKVSSLPGPTPWQCQPHLTKVSRAQGEADKALAVFRFRPLHWAGLDRLDPIGVLPPGGRWCFPAPCWRGPCALEDSAAASLANTPSEAGGRDVRAREASCGRAASDASP